MMLFHSSRTKILLLVCAVILIQLSPSEGARRSHRKHRYQRSHFEVESIGEHLKFEKHHVRRQAGRQPYRLSDPQLQKQKMVNSESPEARAASMPSRGVTPNPTAAAINTRPTFIKCNETSIPEGENAGTFVTKVEAYDPDQGPAGKVRYEIIRSQSAEKQFNVNSYTGEITTAKVFDRDEPKREKLLYVTVKAVDEGFPALDVLCTFSVTITDKNDNAPIFDKNDYRETIPQDSKVNQTVMRVAATDIDEGENARITYSLRANRDESDLDYFQIDPQSGFIKLVKAIEAEKVDYQFELVAAARDGGTPSNETTAQVNIKVVSSNRRAPEFTEVPDHIIDIEESFNDFGRPIVTLRAVSNIEKPVVYFSLVNGQTEDTNKEETFRLVERANGTMDIFLARKLDYETVSNYQLNIRVQNDFDVSAETIVRLRVLDSNDEIPSFIDIESGSVLENSAVQTFVLRIRAIDKDGTSPNNKVTYRLLSNTDTFSIDSETGEIRTLKRLDREETSSYAVTVQAQDGAPSSLRSDGLPNMYQKKFKVEVLDQNDNPPRFEQPTYNAEIAEDADINSKVIEVTARDKDDFAVIRYDITDGNVDNAFMVEEKSGVIRVNNQLDYEKITDYYLRVRASDGIHSDEATVHVSISNVNDNPPIFENMQNPHVVRNIIEEEKRPDPIAKITVRDPDWDKGGKNPYITFSLDRTGQYAKHFRITPEGELFLDKGIDRDPPNGYPQARVNIIAEDRLEPNGKVQSNTLVVEIHLDDINDNAPFLNMEQPVVFNENQKPMLITNLTADDNDDESVGNGPPFQMRIDPNAEPIILTSFAVNKAPSGVWQLHSNVMFDREERKVYNIPIVISDNGGGDPSRRQTGTSTLEVVIGDENDNDMKDGKSAITVYNYKNSLPDTMIGRAYVDDPDDWDLPDKEFTWFDTIQPTYFSLHPKGMITMKAGTPAGEYRLRIKVYDQKWNSQATAEVIVNSIEIPEEAVKKSGSVRLDGVTEVDFITPRGGESMREMLRDAVAKYLSVPLGNVDLFTVRGVNKTIVDARFSVHNSPYWDPVKINGLLGEKSTELKDTLKAEILGIGIDECMKEPGPCDGPCTSFLTILDTPYFIYGNTSSFVGVNAYADYDCACRIGPVLNSPRGPIRDQCEEYCFNGGTCILNGLFPRCECPDNFEGPRCEALEASFNGVSFGWLPSLPACSDGSITFEFTSHTENGLMFYNGPHSIPSDKSITDFVAVELDDGIPVAYINLGSGIRKLQLNDNKNYGDKESHLLELRWNDRQEVRLTLDGCLSTSCSAVDTMPGTAKLLNVNGPIQLGKIKSDLPTIGHELQWSARPHNDYFVGCIRNLRFNNYTFDMASMGHSLNVSLSCKDISAIPVTVLSQTTEIVIIVLSILFLLLLLTLLFALWRRRKTATTYKEFPDDIRENVIQYSDEGGGEEDKYGYDLSVLRMSPDGKPLIGRQYKEDLPQRKGDVGTFLQESKGRMDEDTDAIGIDDLRHYAYEGDGDSRGSLSSLNSGTDDGDIDFGHLMSEFGPRFRKLADMYGLDSDDSCADDESVALTGKKSGESWC
uniref:Af1-cadherin n=1 Tax=Artemia franciscana TaxID=6661 RepID=Q5CCS6_ARTSF|nr:Af1-cadherin [Artemia franciscana]